MTVSTESPKHIQIAINRLSQDPITFGLELFIEQALKTKGIHHGYFEFTFMDNAAIIAINQQYLKRDMPTDVITFNLGTLEDITGDVYISTEQAKINAKAFNNSFENEIKLLIVHAILHLLDYRDYTEAERSVMETEQNRILQILQKKEMLRFKQPNILKSFWVAIRGIWFVIYSQRNMKIHLGASAIALALALYFHLTQTEWLILWITITLVLIMESINTALEISVDLTTKKRKYRAMLSKDIAAGSVLIATINAIIVGYFLFFHHIVLLFNLFLRR